MIGLALIEATAILLWVLAAFSLLALASQLPQARARLQFPDRTAFFGPLMPATILMAIIGLVAILFGRSGAVVLLALLIPAGISYAVHAMLPGLLEPPGIVRRLVLTCLFGGALIVVRQVL